MNLDTALLVAHNRPLVVDEDIAAVVRVLGTPGIATGEQSEALERDFNAWLGSGGSCATSSGTAALYAALESLGVRGGTVAVPSYACAALLDAVHAVGAVPLVADVRPSDGNLDGDALGRAIALHGSVPSATVAVHCFGARAPLEELAAGGTLVEDCAQSIGGVFHSLPVGAVGDASVFSFAASKIVTCGQGGLAHFRDPDRAAAAREFRDGRHPEYRPGFNIRLTDFQAAMVRAQLRRLRSIADRRRVIATRYLQAVPDSVGVDRLVASDGRMPHRLLVRATDVAQRERLKRHFTARGVEVVVPIPPEALLHRYLGLDPAGFPGAELLAATTLSLPLYPALTDAEVERVSAALASAPA